MFNKDEWTNFFKKLRPSFTIPSSYKLSNPLLENEFKLVEKKVQEMIFSAPILHLQTDGWSNVRNESITNYIVNTPTPVFLRSIHTKEQRHIATFLADEIEKVLAEIGEERFLGLITDNGANIKCAREKISRKYPHIVEYGCSCHMLNLIIEDIFKVESLRRFKQHLTSIVTEIKNSHFLHSAFERIQRSKQNTFTTLKLPVKTRWNSMVTCLNSFIVNKNSLQSLVIEDNHDIQDIIKESTVTALLNNDFWEKIIRLHALLSPVAKWTTFFEKNAPIISKVFDCFYEILEQFKTEKNSFLVKAKLVDIAQKRSAKMLRPCHYAANLLEPSVRGKNLNDDQMIEATEFIYNLAKIHPKYSSHEVEIVEALANYKTKHGIFSKEFVIKSEKLPGTTWWNGICSSTKLSILAVDILTLPASTAATERTFST